MKRGRRRLDPRAETTILSLRLPTYVFDALCREASKAGVSLSEFVRRQLPPFRLTKLASDEQTLDTAR